MASLYWSHRDPAGVRSSWKQLCCAGCFGPIATIIKVNEAGYDDCIADGQQAMFPNVMETIWLTVYMPRQERWDGQCDYCGDCFEDAWKSAHRGSSALADREGGSGGPPASTPTDPWAIYHLPESGLDGGFPQAAS